MSINWSGIDNRSLLGKTLRLPLRLLPKKLVLPIQQGPCKGMKWIVGSSNHGCWLGSYELEKQNTIEKYVKPGMAVFDIGANVGFYTLLFSRLVGEEGQVFAFEPFGRNVAYLLHHVRLNRLQNVCVVSLALSNDRCLQPFTVDCGNLQNALVANEGRVPPLAVPVDSLDKLLASNGTVADCRIRAPDLMKLDVEGAEHAVLQGALTVIKESRPMIFVALHGETQRKNCCSFLVTNGYDIYALDGGPVSANADTDEIYALPNT